MQHMFLCLGNVRQGKYAQTYDLILSKPLLSAISSNLVSTAFEIPMDEMKHRQNRMLKQHARAGVAHDLPDAFAHDGFIAVDGAF